MANLPSTSTATFIIPHTWPDVRNAEYEVLQRIAIAAQNIGTTLIVVDNDGRPLWSSRKLSLDRTRRIDAEQADFMISLHFESPRLVDVYSYYAVWQPLQFYHQFGYDASAAKVLTHCDLLSCDSTIADAHARNLFRAARPHLKFPLPQLFHSPPQPYLEPNITKDSKLFYVGINWERISGAKGRHHELLLRLVDEEIVDIYGPRVFLGKRPWEGFDAYRGELPFDGKAVVKAQNASGICLSISSAAHMSTGLMSNRLFEGLAGGAAIIADNNDFVVRHFGDLAYIVDADGSEEELFFQIRSAVAEIRADPKAAMRRAKEGQARLRDMFSLEGALQKLFAAHADRAAEQRRMLCSSASVTVIIPYVESSIEELFKLLKSAERQVNVQVDVAIVCDESFAVIHKDEIEQEFAGSFNSISFYVDDLLRGEGVGGRPTRPKTTGPATARALADVTTDYLAFLSPGEEWFHDHLASVIGAMQRTPGSCVGVSGSIHENDVTAASSTRRVAEMYFSFDENELLSGRYVGEYGRFVYCGSAAAETPSECVELMDGNEPNLVRIMASLAGGVAQTGIATYVRKDSSLSRKATPVRSELEQQQYIRDACAFDSRWRARMTAQSASMRHFERMAAATSTVRWDSPGVPRGAAFRAPLGVDLPTVATGAGVKYLVEGFSYPEATHTWIDGRRGVIEFVLDDETAESPADWEIALRMAGRWSVEASRRQHCTFLLNGLIIGYAEVPEGADWVRLRLPPQTKATPGRMRLEILCDHAEPVLDDAGRIVDARRLSVSLFDLRIDLVKVKLPLTIKAGKTYSTAVDGDGLDGLVDGFSHAEEVGTWLTGDRARLFLRVEKFDAPMALRLMIAGRDSNAGEPQKVTAEVNGRPAAEFEAPESGSEIVIPLTSKLVQDDGVVRLTLRFAHAGPVLDKKGEILDGRALAVLLESMSVDRDEDLEDDQVGPKALDLGKTYSTGLKGAGLKCLAGGFSHPEDIGTWAVGKRAKLEFRITNPKPAMVVKLNLEGRDSKAGRAQRVEIRANGKVLLNADLPNKKTDVLAPLPEDALESDGAVRLALRFAHAEPVTDAKGGVVDGRELAALLESITIEDADSSAAETTPKPAAPDPGKAG